MVRNEDAELAECPEQRAERPRSMPDPVHDANQLHPIWKMLAMQKLLGKGEWDLVMTGEDRLQRRMDRRSSAHARAGESLNAG